jgi:hypothetical protein
MNENAKRWVNEMRNILNLTLAASMLTLVLLLPGANAATYTQTLSGGRWTQRTIYVYVDPTPSWADLTSEGVSPNWAQLTVYQAMEIWNVAQDWFITTNKLNPNGKYELTVTNSPSQAQITVSFPHSEFDCGLSKPYGNLYTVVGGCTTLTDPNGIIKRAQIQLNLDTWSALPFYLDQGTNDTHALRTVALHELGNSMGIWDLPSNSPLKSDLMYASFSEPGYTYPSTLNLYAVYLVASDDLNAGALSINLRSNIQYAQWQPQFAIETPESPVPETPMPTIALLLSVVVLCAIVRRGKRSSRELHQNLR